MIENRTKKLWPNLDLPARRQANTETIMSRGRSKRETIMSQGQGKTETIMSRGRGLIETIMSRGRGKTETFMQQGRGNNLTGDFLEARHENYVSDSSSLDSVLLYCICMTITIIICRYNTFCPSVTSMTDLRSALGELTKKIQTFVCLFAA